MPEPEKPAPPNPAPPGTPAAEEAHEKPPETAENFEHALRRLVIERDRKRGV